MGMIERVSRLMAVWAKHSEPDAWLAYQGIARLVLSQMLRPTKAMTDAPYLRQGDIMCADPPLFPLAYRLMIDAALAEPDQTKPE